VSNKGKTLQRWTAAELETLNKMYLAGNSRQQIADALGSSLERVKHRLRWEMTDGGMRDQRRKRSYARRLQRNKDERKANTPYACVSSGPRPTSDLIELRDQRYAAPMRDLTALYMGDPPVGYSALERRA
jgi:hypothetical protein